MKHPLFSILMSSISKKNSCLRSGDRNLQIGVYPYEQYLKKEFLQHHASDTAGILVKTGAIPLPTLVS